MPDTDLIGSEYAEIDCDSFGDTYVCNDCSSDEVFFNDHQEAYCLKCSSLNIIIE